MLRFAANLTERRLLNLLHIFRAGGKVSHITCQVLSIELEPKFIIYHILVPCIHIKNLHSPLCVEDCWSAALIGSKYDTRES